MKHRIRFFLLLTLAVFLVLASVFVFLWPTLKTARYWHKNDRTIERFTETIKWLQEPGEAMESTNEEKTLPFVELREACERYNAELYSSGQKDLTEETQLDPPFDLSEYGWEEETFAVLSIPDAGIETAVYDSYFADRLFFKQ